jgi:mono/diheme cytochrome c family protein
MKPSIRILALTQIALFLGPGVLGAADVQKGQILYAAKCAACHAKDLKGNPAMSKVLKVDAAKLSLVSKEVIAKADADLIATTTKGKDKMPAQEKKLKAEEIADIIAYVRSVGGSNSSSSSSSSSTEKAK